MEQRKLGGTGPAVAAVGLGCMSIGLAGVYTSSGAGAGFGDCDARYGEHPCGLGEQGGEGGAGTAE